MTLSLYIQSDIFKWHGVCKQPRFNCDRNVHGQRHMLSRFPQSLFKVGKRDVHDLKPSKSQNGGAYFKYTLMRYSYLSAHTNLPNAAYPRRRILACCSFAST